MEATVKIKIEQVEDGWLSTVVRNGPAGPVVKKYVAATQAEAKADVLTYFTDLLS